MKTISTILQRSCCATLIGLVSATGVYAQVSSINSAQIIPRAWNDIPGATLVTVANYPTLISFSESGVSQAGGFANRDRWNFSSDGGTSAYAFANNDFFQATMTVTLTGTPSTPRKEAGFLLSTIGGDGQFIVNTDANEIVAFGGPLPFFAFPATYNSGDVITLGINYFLDSNTGLRSIVYSADGVNSPILPLTNLEQGIIDGSNLGGYFQIVNDPNNPNNSGSAAFANISIVPEPGTFTLVGMGLCGLLAIRRKR
jgi:hypothetical protein